MLSLLADSVARFAVAEAKDVAPETKSIRGSRMDLALPTPGSFTGKLLSLEGGKFTCFLLVSFAPRLLPSLLTAIGKWSNLIGL